VTNITFQVKRQRCQIREWLLHRRQNLLQMRLRNTKADFTHAIAALKCSNDVVHIRFFVNMTLNEERQGRPDIQQVSRGGFECTTKFQIQATRRTKHEASPSSTDM